MWKSLLQMEMNIFKERLKEMKVLFMKMCHLLFLKIKK